jgi:hypothetical protein
LRNWMFLNFEWPAMDFRNQVCFATRF